MTRFGKGKDMEITKKAPVTITFAVINILIFLILSFGGQTEDAYYMLGHGAMYTPLMLEGEYYRIFTSMFLHFGMEHLASNMLSLIVIGMNLEPVLGSVKTALIFVISGLGGNALSFITELTETNPAVSAGASGAIFGLTGALLCLTLMYRGRIGNVTPRGMILMVGLSLYTGYTSDGIDNMAHIGGLITGILLTLILGRKLNINYGPHVSSGADFD